MYNNHRLRPLRSNYRGRLAVGKRGNEEDPPERTRRSMRRISLLATPASDTSSEDDDEDSYLPKRRRRRMVRVLEVASERSTRSRSKRLSISNTDNVEGENSYDGIRRSTRKRNLKFENVNDSWILGAQSLKGYPDFSRDHEKKDSDEEEEEEEYEVEENEIEGVKEEEGEDGQEKCQYESSSSEAQPETTRTRRAVRSSVRRAETQEPRKYSLRKKKPTVQRFQIGAPADPFRDVLITRKRRRRYRKQSTSSSSSSSDDRDRRRKKRTMELVGADGKKDSGKLNADTGLMTLDQSIRFSNIGGLESHVNSLKEMILFPMLYPEIFSKFSVTPPKGVLFHGPPGTGKTLMARALANECSQGNKKVSFFMRKGADVLSKWVGESERQLRLLFQEAHQGRPSIIFFDELDGLAPVRSSKQDQIHSSIVCTLLALMDGLDSRGDIIIIGATNRIDSIDPALRRPGRFDREILFPLPGVKERRDILGIHASWADPNILNHMAEVTAGYSGSDLKALCTEAVIHSLRRVYPQVYHSTKKLLLNPEKVKVEKIDFKQSLRAIVPSAQRSWAALGRKLPTYLEPLLGGPLASLMTYIGENFLMAFNRRVEGSQQVSRSPRLLLVGDHKATSVLSSALLYKLEHCPVLNVAFDTLYTEPGRSPEEVLKQVFKELPHRTACILWFGDVSLWWNNTSSTVRATFESLVSQMDPSLPVLYLGTSKEEELPHQVEHLFKKRLNEVFVIPVPASRSRETFFRPLFRIKALKPPPKPKPKKEEMETLLEAPPTPPPVLTQEQLEAVHKEEENTLRELRIFLRQCCAKLARNKAFYMFSRPVDVNEVPDYLQVIKEPMDLETMMTKIDHLEYTCAEDFLRDIDLMCSNALEYNPDREPADKQIRHRACYLRDTAYALIKAEMDSDFEITCRQIRDERKRRVQASDPSAENIKTENQTSNETETDMVGNADKSSADVSKNNSSQGSSSSVLRKKRRKCMWKKGMVKKPRKNPIESNPNQPGPSSKSDDPNCPRNSSNTHPASDSEEEVEMLNESVESETKLPNGYITGATEDSTDETHGTPKKVLVDREGLSNLLAETVRVTEGRNIERLVDLHGTLSRVIDTYAEKWERTSLVKDLRDRLTEFEEDTSDD